MLNFWKAKRSKETQDCSRPTNIVQIDPMRRFGRAIMAASSFPPPKTVRGKVCVCIFFSKKVEPSMQKGWSDLRKDMVK